MEIIGFIDGFISFVLPTDFIIKPVSPIPIFSIMKLE